MSTKNVKTFAPAVWALLGGGWLTMGMGAAHGEVTVQAEGLDAERWLKPQDSVTLRVDQPPGPAEGRLAFLVGEVDSTVLFRPTAPGRLTYDGRVVPLPSGEKEIAVYLVGTDGQWQEIARIPLKVLTPGGFQKAEVTPRLELTEKSQFQEHVSGDAVHSDRPEFHDAALQGGVTTEHQRPGLTVRGSANIVGTSNRAEALRFAEKGGAAPKVDLSDYLVELESGPNQAAVGHVSYGSHELLINGVANRGVVYTRKLGDRVDASFTAQNGTQIVGFDNLLGLQENDHHIVAGGVGAELIGDRPGGLRVEAAYMSATVRNQLDFNSGEVPDAERSHGLGLRVLGASASGRLTGSAELARSTFRNPSDPLLAQGEEIVPVQETTDNARHLELGYQLLQDYALTEGMPAGLRMTVRHQRVDPLYRSIGAAVNADQEINTLVLDGQLGVSSVQLQHSVARDNLDDAPSVLTTRTRDTMLNVAAPIAQLVSGNETPSPWWPASASYAYQRNHQYGINLPIGFDDPASQIPDQKNYLHNVSFSWSGEIWDLSYSYSRSFQDNRQPGRAEADFKNYEHGVTLGLRLSDKLHVAPGISRVRARDVENAITTKTWSPNFSFDWQFAPQWSLTGNYGYTRIKDDIDRARSSDTTAQTQVSRSFTVPGPRGRKLPGQLFLRHALQRVSATDTLLEIDNDARTWTINGGISLSLF